MKIERVVAYRVELPLYEGTYRWSGGKSVSVFDSTIVAIETDTGLVGYGEVCPLGPFYLPAYAEGVRTGIRELAPHLIGSDPCELLKLNQQMDAALKGHPYVKSGIDIACWDILGKLTGLPVCVLLGGRFGESVRLYRAISQESPEEMARKVAGYRGEGYTRFQLKVGSDSDLDIDNGFSKNVHLWIDPESRPMTCGHAALFSLRRAVGGADRDVAIEVGACKTEFLGRAVG